jgi:hypothetical protein
MQAAYLDAEKQGISRGSQEYFRFFEKRLGYEAAEADDDTDSQYDEDDMVDEPTPPPQPVTVIATDPEGPGRGPARPGEALREADGALNVALPRGATDAFAERLDRQAVVVRTNRPVAAGRKKGLALIADSPAILEAYTLGAGRSADGSFGYTYGRARWTGPLGAQPGYYVRAWRSTPMGWRLLADHLAER